MFFSNELLFQIYFRILSKTFSAICRKTSGRVVKSAFYLSTGAFWENNFFVGKFFNFRVLQTPLLKSFGLFSEKFLAESSKLQSTCLEEQFAEIFFRNISSFWITFDIWQIFWGHFAGTCPAVLSKLYSTCQKETSGRCFLRLFLSKYIPILSKKFSDVWQKKLRQGFRNCIVTVGGNIFRK